MIQKILLGLFATTILIAGCSQERNLNVPIQPLQPTNSVYAREFEPNYVSTLNDQGTQTPDVKNIFRFGKVNSKLYRGGLPTDSDLQALKGYEMMILFNSLTR